MSSYEQKLVEEGELWGNEAERMAQQMLPDWRYHRTLRHNRILHGEEIDALLAVITPGMQALELGCASGWFTLAMAQRGAQATGYDISEKALAVARAYYAQIKDEVSGAADYQYADLNALELPAERYDLIVVKATLHHLVNMRHVIEQVHQALRPGGLFWISDTYTDEHPRTVLMASALMFVLPTHTSYRDKIGGLFKFGLRAPSRIKASIEAEGLSPFEGAGREHDWLAIVQDLFEIERISVPPAVTGYISAQLKLPDQVALPLLRVIKVVDRLLVRLGVLKSSARTVYARKQK
jgi:2-polyprenyl-3-methyl-5-hydroxy-6-metoxy-1,4-benzoquinol methylase